MMLDLLFTLGQAGSALILIYGAVLVLLPQRKSSPEPMLEAQLALKHN
jgi:hypothetical protein